MPFSIKTNIGQCYQWHLNSPEQKPVFNEPEHVVYLCADNDEFAHIRYKFEAVPRTKGNVCIWRDELAQFLFDNI